MGETLDQTTFDFDTEVEEAMKLKESCWTGNLQISLYWEEKIVLILRSLQLYAFFFIVFYEHWPSVTRDYFTPVFTALVGQF